MTTEIRRQGRKIGKFDRTTLYFPPELKAASQEAAHASGITLSAWIAALAARELDMPQYDLTQAAQE